MLDSLNETIKRHLADNIWIYMLVVFMFILGVSLGAIAVNNIDDVAKSDATTYIQGFLDLTSKNELQAAYILKQSIKFNLYFTLVLFFSGMLYLGIVTIPLLIVFRGFCIGFSIAFLSGNMGRNGILLSIGSVLPQNLIYVPVIIILGVLGMNYSLYALRNKYFKKFGAVPNLFASYALAVLILFIMLIAGCIVESYITPFLVRAIAPYVSLN